MSFAAKQLRAPACPQRRPAVVVMAATKGGFGKVAPPPAPKPKGKVREQIIDGKLMEITSAPSKRVRSEEQLATTHTSLDASQIQSFHSSLDA